MTRGESLKRLIRGSGMHIMVRFDGIDDAIDATVALQIWEQLSVDADPVKQDPPRPKQAPDQKAAGKKRKPLDDGKMLALRKAGWPYEKIADEMGCSPQTVINRIKDKE